MDNDLLIDKVINLNLNGKTLSAPSQVLQVQGGTLNLGGKGTIKELQPNYGAIVIKGSSASIDTEYSVVNIGRNIILEGWSGIFINHVSSKSYGVEVNLSGTINAIEDINGDSGIGIYVNGNIKDEINHPVINIADSAVITSDGVGLYIAGYSSFNIGDATITGQDAGIGIKSGNLNIDGAKVTATGQDSTPTSGNSNGINSSGSTIQIESNTDYAGNIDLNIKDGSFVSSNSYTIYEYIGKGNSSKVHSMEISGGIFKSTKGNNIFAFSNSFNENNKEFISGGYFSSDPSLYLKNGYTASFDKAKQLYDVSTSAMKEITIGNITITQNPNNLIKGIIIIIVLTTTVIITYKNRIRILRLFKN